MNFWFTENHSENAGITLHVKQTLYSGQSEYQQIDIVETYEFGRMLLLDGLIMVTERDEFIYHEMIAHPALFTHPRPAKVLVIGGGDGGTVREVAKHTEVEHVVLCENDQEVIDQALVLLPAMASAIDGSDSRVQLRIDDGLAYMRENLNAFDVILVDSTDQLDQDFFRAADACLREDGILVAQSESPFFHADLQKRMYANLRETFPGVAMYQAAIPTYPSGYWSFAFASKKHHPVDDFDRARAADRSFATRYYNEDLHLGAFMLPTFVRENIAERRKAPRH